MIINIYKNGVYSRTIEGDETQCMSNVGKEETYEEVDFFPSLNFTYTDVLKYNKINLVASIEVLYNGTVYQGDEISQDRMSRAIVGMDDDDTIEWKAKDNSKVTLLKSDLKQILRLAGIEQTKLW